MGFYQTLVIPYLNAKLALKYTGIGMMVNFHIKMVQDYQVKGTVWADHGPAYREWLANLLTSTEDSQVIREQLKTEVDDQGHPALMDRDGEEEEDDDGQGTQPASPHLSK